MICLKYLVISSIHHSIIINLNAIMKYFVKIYTSITRGKKALRTMGEGDEAILNKSLCKFCPSASWDWVILGT